MHGSVAGERQAAVVRFLHLVATLGSSYRPVAFSPRVTPVTRRCEVVHSIKLHNRDSWGCHGAARELVPCPVAETLLLGVLPHLWFLQAQSEMDGLAALSAPSGRS